MSVGEAAFSYTSKDPRGNLATVRGNSYEEFLANVNEAFGFGAQIVLDNFASAFGQSANAGDQIEQATRVVQGAFPQAQPVSSVGQPLPQPGTAPQPQAAPPAPPVQQGPAYPGDCAHGRRVWKSSVTSRGQWNRWDCAVPYSKEAQGRCKAVNA